MFSNNGMYRYARNKLKRKRWVKRAEEDFLFSKKDNFFQLTVFSFPVYRQSRYEGTTSWWFVSAKYENPSQSVSNSGERQNKTTRCNLQPVKQSNRLSPVRCCQGVVKWSKKSAANFSPDLTIHVSARILQRKGPTYFEVGFSNKIQYFSWSDVFRVQTRRVWQTIVFSYREIGGRLCWKNVLFLS
jgi:hypothetical protein